MKDVKIRIEKLQTDALDCEIIAKLATNSAKRESFERLADAYRRMAAELQDLIESGKISNDGGGGSV
ncbi:MAG: hypothetical protein OJF48_001878 [Afipia sp.]|jgi:predicted transcriptional regulator|nr:MAG: hypothetical protein OJF48_001878 [Afipia sp.]